MSDEAHARVKELFARAIELSPEERNAFLDEACGDDAEIRERVDALVASHFPDSIVGGKLRDRPEHPSSSVSIGRNLSAILGGQYRRPVIVATALALIGLGLWTESRVEESLRRIRAEELRTVLAADVTALEVWIREYEAQARQWARDPRLLPHVEALVELGKQGTSAREALRESPARRSFVELMRPWRDEAPGNDADGLFTREGFLLSAGPTTGIQMNEIGMSIGVRVFEGETVFLRPFRQDFVLDTDNESLAREMFTAVSVPIRNASGDVIAAMYVARRASGPFTDILQVARVGASGETYAFDDEGWMLSESRFTEELRELGVVRFRGEDVEAESAQLALQVRDPGGDLLAGHQPELESGARPLTRVAALAIASRDKDDPELQRGVITTPYRNYRGSEVIGAWQWLPQHEFGIATEIEVTEAFAPLRYLQITFGVLFALLTIAVAATFASSFSVVRLRRRVHELTALGPYKLVKPIGQGGMGQVFLAEHALLKRPTAVKTLALDHLNETNVARFEREVRLASQLEHPNTIRIYDFGRTPDNVLYYAMEYVDGLTLAELVAQDRALPPSRVAHLLSQVCGSLEEAHGHGLIHRDIKPQNIMVCEKGGVYDVVKVLDFGLAKPIDESATRDLTGGLHVGGTPLYMAPERLDAPESVDARADVYAVGAVAYHLLSAKPLFPYSGVELLHHVMQTEPEPLATLVPNDVPSELVELVTRCLDKEPAKRPQNMSAFREQLFAVPGLPRWRQRDARAWWEHHTSSQREPVHS